MAQETSEQWRGTPLEAGIVDPHGITEVVIEYDTGQEDTLRPRLGEEYGSYELQQAAAYLRVLAGELERNADMSL